MNPIGMDPIMVFDNNDEGIVRTRAGLPLATSVGHPITSYRSLLQKVAALHYHNPRFKLLFRGQSKDYKSIVKDRETSHSNLFPSLLRGNVGEDKKALLDRRFQQLRRAEDMLVKRIHEREIMVHQLVRWAVLQHYHVCPTPLLDVTHSLQSALSFASSNNSNSGYLYVLAVPQTTVPISISLESLTQVVDLQQLCPPDALRPHFQSAALIGDYPIVTSTEMTHGRAAMIGNNFSCRLLSKFSLSSIKAWGAEGFRPIASSVLFPDDADSWYKPTQEIRMAIGT